MLNKNKFNFNLFINVLEKYGAGLTVEPFRNKPGSGDKTDEVGIDIKILFITLEVRFIFLYRLQINET